VKAEVRQFKTRLGTPETRLYLHRMACDDGEVVVGVTIYPHPCGTCVGGDHVHIDTLQSPATDTVLGEVELTEDEVAAVRMVIASAKKINQFSEALFARMKLCSL